MIIGLIKFLFEQIVGLDDIPEDKKAELRSRLNDVLEDCAKAAAEGAVEGLKGA